MSLLPRHSRSWGRALALLTVGAACSGRVEQGGVSPSAGGAGGSPGGSSSVGGTGGVGGTAGSGGATGSGGTDGFGGATGTGGFSCFVAGTKISTPTGSTPIERLEVGDVVLAYDELTARVVSRPVTATFVHHDHAVGALTTSEGHTLRVTANHPIYLPDQGRYVDAGELRGDERLLALRPEAGVTSMIAAAYAESPGERATVYNITVPGEQNYFAEGVLVHNKSCAGPLALCMPSAYNARWNRSAGCIDPSAPTSEFILLNQSVAIDGGVPDADAATDAGNEVDPPDGGAEWTVLETAVCAWDPSRPAHLAFEMWSASEEPAVLLYDQARSCAGREIGHVRLSGATAPPPRTWTTQCVRLPQQGQGFVALIPPSGETQVTNPRFVAGCECPRTLLRSSGCQLEVPDGGSGCE